MSGHKVFILAFFLLCKDHQDVTCQPHRFSFWPKYVGPIGFQPGFWLKTFVLPLCGTSNGDMSADQKKSHFVATHD
jgi:hypothetical protein